MASKFMANAAFEARLLLRPSHQRTVWTVNKLEYPIPGRPMLPRILSFRSYSDSTSTPTPPFPKSSGSTEGSQSFGPEDKTYSDSTSTCTPPFPNPPGLLSARGLLGLRIRHTQTLLPLALLPF